MKRVKIVSKISHFTHCVVCGGSFTFSPNTNQTFSKNIFLETFSMLRQSFEAVFASFRFLHFWLLLKLQSPHQLWAKGRVLLPPGYEYDYFSSDLRPPTVTEFTQMLMSSFLCILRMFLCILSQNSNQRLCRFLTASVNGGPTSDIFVLVVVGILSKLTENTTRLLYK